MIQYLQDGTDVIAIETPDDLVAGAATSTIPQLFQHAAAAQQQQQHDNTPAQSQEPSSHSNVEAVFDPFYLYVEEEHFAADSDSPQLSEHERQLLLEYKAKEMSGDVVGEATSGKGTKL